MIGDGCSSGAWREAINSSSKSIVYLLSYLDAICVYTMMVMTLDVQTPSFSTETSSTTTFVLRETCSGHILAFIKHIFAFKMLCQCLPNHPPRRRPLKTHAVKCPPVLPNVHPCLSTPTQCSTFANSFGLRLALAPALSRVCLDRSFSIGCRVLVGNAVIAGFGLVCGCRRLSP